jgi:hypothetical protein
VGERRKTEYSAFYKEGKEGCIVDLIIVPPRYEIPLEEDVLDSGIQLVLQNNAEFSIARDPKYGFVVLPFTTSALF